MKKIDEFDVVIVGAGFVGSLLASVLQSSSLNIAVLEQSPKVNSPQDKRSIVLSHGSRLLLERFGLWSSLKPFSFPIHTIELSDAGHLGMTHLSKDNENVEALGYVIEGGQLQKQLEESAVASPLITYFRPAKLLEMNEDRSRWKLKIFFQDKYIDLSAKLVVGADGAFSSVRRLQQVATTEYDYEETALIANVDLKRTHNHGAYERFTTSGAIAFLPLPNNKAGLVWSAPSDLAKELLALEDADFLKRLQKTFGFRLGKLTNISKRIAFPLKLTVAKDKVGEGWVLLGNAAQTLHPIAAQGFNLGLRDVASLVQLLLENSSEHYFSKAFIKDYRALRKRDHKRTIDFTHRLVRVFSSKRRLFILGRALASFSAEFFPPVNRHITLRSLGL